MALLALAALPLVASLPLYDGVVLRRDGPLNATASVGHSTHSGVAKFAFQQGIAGACGTVHGDDALIVGLHTDLYGRPDEVSPLCGTTVFIQSPSGTLSAQVADACVGDCGIADDLVVSTAIYDQLGGKRDDGLLQVQWKINNAPAAPSPVVPAALNSCQQEGVARFGFQKGVAGSCGAVHQDTDLIVAVRQDVMGTIVKCGDTIAVQGKRGARLDLLVADVFTAGDAADLVLSTGVFDTLGGVREHGLLHMTWSPFGCDAPSPPDASTPASAPPSPTTDAATFAPSASGGPKSTTPAPSPPSEAPSAPQGPGAPSNEPSASSSEPPAPSSQLPAASNEPTAPSSIDHPAPPVGAPPPPAEQPSPPSEQPAPTSTTQPAPVSPDPPPPAPALTTEPSAPPPAQTPSPAPPLPAPGATWQQEALAVHNAFRDRFGVPHLTWDDTLAAAGQAWSDTCIWAHSDGPYGENRAIGYEVTAAINAWNDELSLYDYNAPGYSHETGHFTQDVWKATTKLGCGLSDCPAGKNFVCEYDPAGNVLGPNGDTKYFVDNVPRPLW